MRDRFAGLRGRVWRAAALRLLALLAPCAIAHAGPAEPPWALQVQQFVLEAARHQTPGRRIEVQVGTLDARLRLAPCRRTEPHLAGSQRLWGSSRVGLRCVDGATPWNVSVPVTVKVFGLAYVAAAALPAGNVLGSADMIQAEVDLAENPSKPFTDPARAAGRTLVRAVPKGQVLRESHLRPRIWFAAGEQVRLISRGSGFQVTSTGQALTPGIEGQPVRARTESGRVVTGAAVAIKEIDLTQ